MPDINLLKEKIADCGLDMGKLASKMGMDRSTLYRKLNNQGEKLTVGDLKKIKRILNLSKDESMRIFFDNFVA
ncbi:helix-turn-helix domain-containing protein [Lysinibacillus sphaericus]|uniref:helix-turn-helix domain-containing protein n=1 Tax=Lysinibacillus sphaericus TaxID=1421 RepID=UPI00056A25A6|nr:helix-turn-helix transcriptional regulator [Lysinibacillus sphaericus]